MTSRTALLKRLDALAERQAADAIDADKLRQTVRLMRATVPRSKDEEQAACEASDAIAEMYPEVGPGWAPWEFHENQASVFHSDACFTAEEAGRGTGKTEGKLRGGTIEALDIDWPLPRKVIVFGAATQAQTMRLYWDPLLEHIPGEFIVTKLKSPHYYIDTITGARIYLLGMDEADRARGLYIDRLYLDEFASMKPEVYKRALRGALNRKGRPKSRAWLYGTPDLIKGDHFVKLCDDWKAKMEAGNTAYSYTWRSGEGIISPEAWEEAKKELSPAEFAVEYEARRVTTGNRAYHEFQQDVHAVSGLGIVSTRPLAWCFDFNVEPGVAVIAQRQHFEDYTDDGSRPEWAPEALAESFWAVVGEVYIPKGSNTPSVVRKLIDDYGGHKGRIELYGDATGGARGTAKTDGSDWEIIERMAVRHFGRKGVVNRVPRANPPERMRVNATNAAFRTADDVIRSVVDKRCKFLIRDFERVTIKQGSAGELHKPSKGPGSELSHISDAAGYLWAAHAEQRSKRVVGGRW